MHLPAHAHKQGGHAHTHKQIFIVTYNIICENLTRLLRLAADFGSLLLERSSECKALVP